MKHVQAVASLVMAALLVMLALPKAIGLSVMYYLESLPLSQFGDGPPTDLKALHEATEKAFRELGEGSKKMQDALGKAIEEARTEGNTLYKKTADELDAISKANIKTQEVLAELKTRTLEVEQKLVKNPAGGGGGDHKSVGQIVAESPEWKAANTSGQPKMESVNVGSFHKTTIVNATGQNQPLVMQDQLPGIQMPALKRLTVRDLLPQNRTSSNLVQYARELLFTNAAAPQGSVSPIGHGEGEPKAESSLTFELANSAVSTIAHWIPASRQILSDAPMLQGYIDGRLRFGLLLEEEDELLNGSGAAGELSGLVTNATAFDGGGTNQTALDTLLKAFLQISLQNMEASGVVLHPTDWAGIMLAKDTTGRYLFSDPHSVEAPRVWGKTVVATASQTSGQFLAGAFTMAAEIFDREDANVRVAEQHSDFFIRNLVAILAEERLALVIYRTAAIVKGSISTPG